MQYLPERKVVSMADCCLLLNGKSWDRKMRVTSESFESDCFPCDNIKLSDFTDSVEEAENKKGNYD